MNRWPGVDSTQELGELDAQLGVFLDIEDDQLRVELTQRANLVLPEGLERHRDLERRRGPSLVGEEHVLHHLTEAPIGRDQGRADGPLMSSEISTFVVSLDQLQNFDQRPAVRAAGAAGAGPMIARLDVVGRAFRIDRLEEDPDEVA